MNVDYFDRAIEVIGEQIAEGTLIWIALFGALFVISLISFFRGLYIYKKRSVESANFMVFCVPVIVWGGLLLSGPLLGFDTGEGTWLYFGIESAGWLIAPLLMLHIWSQVSYRPITVAVYTLWLVVPVFLIAMAALETYDPWIEISGISVYYDQIPIVFLLASLYLVIILVKAYLLCFNVFYQMPKHMRRSTYQMLTAITAILIANGISILFDFPENTLNVVVAIAYIISVNALFTAFFIANSSNVIVTSRDFVFSSLSTIVITVSLKGNILDWNHKKKDGCHPLPDPKYKEPYNLYRKRIIETHNGTISPHDENILCISGDEGENHFLFTWHDISYLGRKFGYLVEIAEVTKSYSKLRYIEEIAYYDNLTSLHNRNAYIERVKQIAVDENMPLLIIVGDVNNLKMVNDRHGHLNGDKLLLTITEAVKDNAPERAFVARIGGDELVLLVPNAEEREATEFIAGVTAALDAIIDPELGTPSISWGYSIMAEATEEYNDVFRAADAIMYEAKRAANQASISGVVPR